MRLYGELTRSNKNMIGYTDTIRRWATDNRYAGIVDDADGTGEVGLGEEEAGRRLAVRFTLKVERERVTDARFQVFGCGFTIAACAVAADLSLGHPLAEVAAIDARRLDLALDGLPDERGYCAELAAEALQSAVKSARNGRTPVKSGLAESGDHGPVVREDDPLYLALMESASPEEVVTEDRHLFACLLTVAAREPAPTAAALGLPETDLQAVLQTFFPDCEQGIIEKFESDGTSAPPEPNDEVTGILFSYLPERGESRARQIATWFVYIVSARVAHTGHLWVAMGLHERPQLTAAIRRHLPAMAKANQMNMRWKKFLYKQVCDRNGGMMCKAPNCGVCSDHAICFADD